MAILTLRAARKLDARLGEFINAGFDSEHHIHVSHSVNGWIDGHEELSNKSIKSIANAIEVRSQLRGMVQTTNQIDGINDLIGKRKLLIDTAKLYQAIKQRYEQESIKVTTDILQCNIDNTKLRLKSDGYASDVLTICTLSTTTYDNSCGLLTRIRIDIERIDAELHQKNLLSTIVFDDFKIDWLKENQLM